MLRLFEPPYLWAIKYFRSFQIKVWPISLTNTNLCGFSARLQNSTQNSPEQTFLKPPLNNPFIPLIRCTDALGISASINFLRIYKNGLVVLRVFERPYLWAIKYFRSFQIKVWPHIIAH
jgi:hypothetical protein